ncbi:hypothetical protein ANN_14994 [Periplaneta americana]|uniref:Uncharacterized protein n=1 Tax=Periplaneta americana TaxID=6978 RepID=A0ABQ8SZ58_PERAM|nr:hypothetical protein ANN_14994 [Periplaneta americana]
MPPLPETLEDIRHSIIAAIAFIFRGMLRVWQEFDHRVDACRNVYFNPHYPFLTYTTSALNGSYRASHPRFWSDILERSGGEGNHRCWMIVLLRFVDVRPAVDLSVLALRGMSRHGLHRRVRRCGVAVSIPVRETSLAQRRDGVTGEWRKLHNVELHAFYSSPDIIRNIKSRRLRWAGHVAHMGEFRNAYRVLVGRPEGKRPLGRARRRWENNIKMDLREVEYDDRDWINLAQDRDRWRAYVRAAMNLLVL